MPSALLPDTSDEVVEVFTGDSLEQAMAFAVASLGPDLTVRRARKLRKGVQGLRGKETYEVAAVPAQRVSPEDALDDAFASLLHEAEIREVAQQEPSVPTPRVRRTVRPSSPPLLPPALPLPAGRTPRATEGRVAEGHAAEVPALEERAVPEPVPVRVPRPTAGRAAPKAAAPARPKAPRPRTKAAKATAAATAAAAPATGWSRTRLAALGLPRRVLAALPATDPRDDAAWIRALTKALATALPAPAAPGDAHPVVVDGYGVAGVLGLLEAARRGMTPGTITDHGRTAPATATELALVVRAALVG